MEQRESNGMSECFAYVRDVFRNASRLLSASEIVLSPYRFVAYSVAWRPFEIKPTLDEPEHWLPSHAVRQFHRLNEKGKEVFTVGVVFWWEEQNDSFVPLAMTSYMRIRADLDDVYWVPLLQAWHRGGKTDGTVQVLQNDRDDYRSDYEGVLAEPDVASVAVPLVDITLASELDARLIRPLMQHIRVSR